MPPHQDVYKDLIGLIRHGADHSDGGARRGDFGNKRHKDVVPVKSVDATTSTCCEDDLDQAEESIFHAVENTEKAVLGVARDLVSDEVNTLFGTTTSTAMRRHHDHQVSSSSTTQKLNSRKVKNVDRKSSSRTSDHHVGVDDEFDEAEEHIFHAVEDAEKAILGVARDLVSDEVNTLFGTGAAMRRLKRARDTHKKEKSDDQIVHANREDGLGRRGNAFGKKSMSSTITTSSSRKKKDDDSTEEKKEFKSMASSPYLDFMQNYAEHYANEFGV